MMNETSVPQRFKRLPVTDAATHLFQLGQLVRLTNALSPSGNVYRITAKLPPMGGSPQYRIQNESEKFERMATQANLELASADAANKGDPLVERTFGLNPKAEATPLRGRKRETAKRADAAVPRAE